MTDEAVDMPTAEAVIDSVRSALPALQVDGLPTLKPCYANDVWFLATSAGTVVAKVRRIPEEDPVQILGQERALTWLAEIDFPTPELLYLEPESETLGGRQLSILRFIEGQPADECFDLLTPDEQRDLFRDFGAIVGRLHALDLPAFAGWVDDSGNPHTTWADVLRHMLREAVDELVQADPGHGIPVDLTDHATAVLGPAIDTIAEPTPRLVHRDLHLGNLMVHNGRANGLLDFEMVREWDPRWDFPKIGEKVFTPFPDSTAQFARGYGEHVPDQQEESGMRDWLYTGFRHLACAADYLDGNAAYAQAPQHLATWLADGSPCGAA
jgi:aminoglycoside phosphotransferase (APT) family kinase protein